MSLKTKVVSAAKWSAFAEIASKGITPIIFIVLAWILTPKDFGLVAIATMVISFSQIFWDAGLSKALIQRQGDVEKTANIVFWTNMVLGVVIYGLLFLSAGFIAHLFKEPLAEAVIKVQGLQIILASLFSIQTALFQKELNFKKLFYVRLLTSVLPGFASIPFALWGFGYWALVVGSLVGAFGQLILLWLISSWRPQLKYDTQIAKQLFRFGLWVTGEGLLGWVFVWGDALIVGAYLGTEDLGLYRTGITFVLMFYTVIFTPLSPVLFSALSRLQNDREKLNSVISKVTLISILVSIPLGVGLFSLRELIEMVIFGEKWMGIAVVIGVFALLNALTWIVGFHPEGYRAIGLPDINTKIMLFGLCYYLPVYLMAIPYGLTTFLWARLACIFLTFTLRLYIAYRLFSLPIFRLFGKMSGMILYSIVVYFVMHMTHTNLQHSVSNGLVLLIFEVLIGMGLYLLYFLYDVKYYKSAFHFLKEG